MPRFSVKKLADKLRETRGEEKTPNCEPPPCTCEPISMGCHCGRFQWEQAQKSETRSYRRRQYPIEPKAGKAYIVSRPPNEDIDYAGVPFRVWAKCEGMWVEVDAVEEDENVKGIWWCWCNVSNITKQGGDEHWFPNDGLLSR